MTLMTAVLVTSVLFAAEGEEPKKTQTAPFVVAVCVPAYAPNSVDGIQLKLIGAYMRGSWLPNEFFPISIFPKEDESTVSPFRPEQNAFLEALLNKTFFLCADPSVTYLPKEKTVAWMIDRRYLGLNGQLTGTLVEDNEERGTFDRDGDDGFLAMTNIREACGSMTPSQLTSEEEALVCKRVRDSVIDSVKEYMSTNDARKIDPQFDPRRYHAPKITRVLRCQLPSGWSGFWVRSVMAYPVGASPESEIPKNSRWSGYHYCLLQTNPRTNNSVLWEYADNLCSTYVNREFDLQGIFDGDKDGVPEFAICRHGHELCHYLLAHAANGELVEISSIIGVL